MTAKRRKHRRVAVESSGVHVRVYLKAGRYWLDVRHGSKRTRQAAGTTDLATAKENAEKLADEMARQRLTGITPDRLTLGQLFSMYHEHKGKHLEGQYQRAAETRQTAFLGAWGSDFPVAAISQTSVDSYCTMRRRAWAAPRSTDAESTPPRVLRAGGLDADFRWLASAMNWAIRHKLTSGKRLLSFNPLRDTKWPKEKNVRRPVATHARYLETAKHADAIDPMGRLRGILALARYTGRRESAILELRLSDLLLSKDRVAAALATAGMDVGLAEHMPNGAIRWTAENDKMGVQHITPIAAELKAELEAYTSANPRVGDHPLFPSAEKASIALSRSTATKWLVRAETLAELPRLTGGLFHPYRRLWATERQHLSDVAVAAGGGWKSTKTLKIYQQIDPASVLAAVVNAR